MIVKIVEQDGKVIGGTASFMIQRVNDTPALYDTTVITNPTTRTIPVEPNALYAIMNSIIRGNINASIFKPPYRKYNTNYLFRGNVRLHTRLIITVH